jgi:hypothetical protein
MYFKQVETFQGLKKRQKVESLAISKIFQTNGFCFGQFFRKRSGLGLFPK